MYNTVGCNLMLFQSLLYRLQILRTTSVVSSCVGLLIEADALLCDLLIFGIIDLSTVKIAALSMFFLSSLWSTGLIKNQYCQPSSSNFRSVRSEAEG